ncbi:MAG: type II secretion system protein [Candidatus Rokuibacteriota bacterium]
MLRRLRGQRGVTLVELMVVVAIIAIIAAIAITLYQDIQKKSKLAADQGTIAALRSASAIYFGKNNGIFPTATTLGTLVVPAPPVFQCSGGTFASDTTNGKVTYTPNDIASC